MNTGKLELISTFVRVVETGSFTAVANETASTQPTISRQIGALESHLGVRLLHRSTRALTLTDEGQRYYEQCLQVLDAVSEADVSVRPEADQIVGTLRISASLAFGRRHVLPRLERFLEQCPQVVVDLVLGDESVDLVRERIDLAIRIGAIRDESLVARRIGETRRIAVASPGYLAGRSYPRHPADLVDHECIVMTSDSALGTWTFRNTDDPRDDAAPISVEVSGRVRVNASGAIPEAVSAGFGIALTPTWQWRDEVERGELVRLLERFEPPPLPIHAVYPTRRHVAPRIRAFVGFLAREFAIDPSVAGRGVASAGIAIGLEAAVTRA